MKSRFFLFLGLLLILGLLPLNFSSADSTATRLKGRILLQVESKGEAWYVNPDNEKRYYLGRPADAFQVMRDLGLGISNKDFNFFNGKAPARLSGKILIKVEDNGKAYYVNPVDLKLHYLGKPADAFQIMRELGLGIINTDIATIPVYQKNNTTTAITINNQVQPEKQITPNIDFTRPAEAPSIDQLKKLVAMCNLSEDLTKICNSETFITGYFTNITFRFLVDDLAKDSEEKLAKQQAESELARQRYLLYLQTISQPIIINNYNHYETYSLPVYSGGLKIESPQLNSPLGWSVQWVGGGGGIITNSSGKTTNFQCDKLLGKCFSL